MDIATGVPPPSQASIPPTMNTTFTGQNTIYVNNLNERNTLLFFILGKIFSLFQA